MLGCAKNLDAFLGEISIETGEREAGTINGRLADLAMKPNARPFQFHLQLLRVGIVKTFDGNHRHCLALMTRRSIRCSGCGYLVH